VDPAAEGLTIFMALLFLQHRWYAMSYPPDRGGRLTVNSYSAFSIQILVGTAIQGLFKTGVTIVELEEGKGANSVLNRLPLLKIPIGA